MLGTKISDPQGIEGPPGEASGLGLLDVDTELTGDKTLTEAIGIAVGTGAPVHGYEMHVGRTSGPGNARPMIRLADGVDGAVSADGKVMGCYLHGLFASDLFRHAFLDRIRARPSSGVAYDAEVERVLDDLADHLETHLDVDGLLAAAAPIDG
jgi:adenosylcobyric acid synthase